jgi:hypothetical protein
MSSSLLKAVLSVLVIEVALFLVGKTLVGRLNFLEFFFVSTAVGVLLKSKLSIILFDLIECRVLLNAENFVEFCVINLFRWTTWTWTSHFL